MAHPAPPYETIHRRMALALIVINSLGALVPNVYLTVIDPLPTGLEPLGRFGLSETLIFASVMVVTFVAGSAWNRKRDRRLSEWYRRLRSDAATRAPEEVRRDALNQAPRSAAVTAALWAAACVFSAWVARSYRALVGIGLGGVLSTATTYLVMDLLWRPAIPLFFPDSDLVVAHAFRLPVLGRLLVIFLLIGVIPPALLAGLTWSRAHALIDAPNPQAVLTNLSVLQVFVLTSSVVVSVGLAILVTRGIVSPLDRLQEAMARVERHDLEARVPVTTNDELGYLAARFNEMAAGLQERERIRLAHQQVEQELAVAGRIQAGFLPRELPHIPGWQIVAALQAAKQTSGDFYDVIALPNGRFAIVVADVADKGTGAALYMALSRTLIRTYAVEFDRQPERVLRAANRRILADAQADLFVTTFYGVLDPGSGTLAYCNAGHNPPYLIDGEGSGIVELCRTGMPLGVLEDAVWECQKIEIAHGDLLVLYSDGITEARNEADELFGAERLRQAARANAARPAREARDTLLAEVEAFRQDAPQSDDMTLLIVARESEQDI